MAVIGLNYKALTWYWVSHISHFVFINAGPRNVFSPCKALIPIVQAHQDRFGPRKAVRFGKCVVT